MTANLVYKMPNVSQKDKIISLKKIIFIFKFFIFTIKYISCTLVCTGGHREDHWVRIK